MDQVGRDCIHNEERAGHGGEFSKWNDLYFVRVLLQVCLRSESVMVYLKFILPCIRLYSNGYG